MILLLPLLLQVGPFTTPTIGGAPEVELPAGSERRAPNPRTSGRSAGFNDFSLAPPSAPNESGCFAVADQAPEKAIDLARAGLAKTSKPTEISGDYLCLGMAYSRLGRWSEAQSAFLFARNQPSEDRRGRARLGAMAGSAALAANDPGAALPALEQAMGDAASSGDHALIAGIAIDRARALVALKREAEAEAALAEARAIAPANTPEAGEAWLLSATLARRQGLLPLAQKRIEQAAVDAPRDPAVGLEAGVIAALAGRDAAARESWRAVIAMAPESEIAQTAKDYLAQLDTSPPAGAGRPAPAKP